MENQSDPSGQENLESSPTPGMETGKQASGPDHRPAVTRILRARSRLIVCLWTLPVYAVAVWVLLSNQHQIDTFMFIYMAMWAGFAVDMASRRCPACGEQFFVKAIFLNLLSRRCVHCKLDLDTALPADEGAVKF